jgi:hypothetical protein
MTTYEYTLAEMAKSPMYVAVLAQTATVVVSVPTGQGRNFVEDVRRAGRRSGLGVRVVGARTGSVRFTKAAK